MSSTGTMPLYCRKCGSELSERKTVLLVGYDPFTGVKRTQDQVTRICAQADVVGHDTWVLVNGMWVGS